MLTGNRTGMDTGTMFVTDKLSEALANARTATEAITAVVWRRCGAVRHTFIGIRIATVACTTDLYAMEVDRGSITTHRGIPLGLEKHRTVIIKSN